MNQCSHAWASPEGNQQLFALRWRVPQPKAGETIVFKFDHEVEVERAIGALLIRPSGTEIELRMGGQAIGGLHDEVGRMDWKASPTPWANQEPCRALLGAGRACMRGGLVGPIGGYAGGMLWVCWGYAGVCWGRRIGGAVCSRRCRTAGGAAGRPHGAA